MMWLKRDIKKEDAVRLLRRAFAKIVIAERLLYDKRLRTQLVVTTALAGVPLSGDFFSGLYCADAFSDIKKAIKVLNKLAPRSSEIERAKLEGAREVLEKAHKRMHPSRLKSIITEALAILEEF